jgi:RNA polymerase sigma-70 factor (ECF subfamily)
MNDQDPGNTERLLELVGRGDRQARQELLGLHRDRLRRMVAVRMDRRLAARVDPSDIVQESLAEAHQKLSEYLRERPLPFYPWLRQFAFTRLLKLHRHHVLAQRRSVTREQRWALPLPDQSVMQLGLSLIANGTSPSRRMMRDELRERVRKALAGLSDRDREVLVLRHLEQLSTAEVAGVLGITTAAVMTRHTRALDKLRVLLNSGQEQDQ